MSITDIQRYVEAQKQAEEHVAFVQALAHELQEEDERTRYALHLIVRSIGMDAARKLLQVVKHIEATGGLMTVDGSRRRTIGGVYFWCAKQQYQDRLPLAFWQACKSPIPPMPKKEKLTPIMPMTWRDRFTIIEELRQKEGLATVKITLVGRPYTVNNKGTCTMLTMRNSKKPSLPSGMPTPPTDDTLYTVYISAKQWRKVQSVMEDQEDILILEGHPQLDLATKSISVFVTSAQSKKLQQALREKQKAEASARAEAAVRG